MLTSSSSGAAGPTRDRRTRSQAWQLAGPFSGIVAVVASWLIAIPRIRILGEELGAEMPALVNVLVDHGGMITIVAVLLATMGITALQWVRRPAVRSGISLVTSFILFVVFIWDIAVFWLIYVATLDGVG